MHHRKRRGKRRARGLAMCLAQKELTRCHRKWNERGAGCEFHDHKVDAVDQEQTKPVPVIYTGRQRQQRRESVSTSLT
jgi:hypothetical protein